MARTVTADAEDFARFFFRLIEERGTGGNWLAARDVLDQAASAYPTHPFVEALAENPGRRVVFSAAAERVRRSEFAHIERKKRGTRRGAPVFYRLSRPMLTGAVAETPAPDAAMAMPEPSTPTSDVAGLPACMSNDQPGASPRDTDVIGAHGTLHHLRRRLEAAASGRNTWWAGLYEPLMRIIARLQAVLAGR